LKAQPLEQFLAPLVQQRQLRSPIETELDLSVQILWYRLPDHPQRTRSMFLRYRQPMERSLILQEVKFIRQVLGINDTAIIYAMKLLRVSPEPQLAQ
jgi:hypothetical protein